MRKRMEDDDKMDFEDIEQALEDIDWDEDDDMPEEEEGRYGTGDERAMMGEAVKNLGMFLSSIGAMMQSGPRLMWMPAPPPDKYTERQAKEKLTLILKSLIKQLTEWVKNNPDHPRKNEVDGFLRQVGGLLKQITNCEISPIDLKTIRDWVKSGSETFKPKKPLKDAFGDTKFSHWEELWGKDIPPEEDDFEGWFDLITVWGGLIFVKNKWGYPKPGSPRWKPRFKLKSGTNTSGEDVKYVTITVYNKFGKPEVLNWPVHKSKWDEAKELVKAFNTKFSDCRVFPKRTDAEELKELSKPKQL